MMKRGWLAIQRSVAVLLLTLTLAAGLSGCLVNRVFEVREQFCAFEENFEIRFAHRPSVDLLNPVLLDSDVTWLAGTPPTSTVRTPDGLTLTWVIEEAVPRPDPLRDVTVEFGFDRLDGEFRLSRIRFDPKFDAFFNPDYLDRATLRESAQNICQTGLSLGTRQVDLDISDRDLEMLPGRSEILEAAGPPHSIAGPDGGWVYRYRLKDNPDESKVARFTVWFDAAGEKPVRMESSYSRYRTSADFVARKMSMNVKL